MALKSELRQNFTVASYVLKDVIEQLNILSDDRIVEVGCGKGMLSKEIILKLGRNSGLLLGYEVDNDLREDLEFMKGRSYGRFDYRLQNFLEAKPKTSFNKCTGNIPYHISEPLFFKLIDWNFEHIVFITGMKFAKKVTGEIPGKLATISSHIYESKIMKTYDKNIFFPKSKVDSALLVMVRKNPERKSLEGILSYVMRNTSKKHAWLNKLLGYANGQTGQIYHMDLDLLVNTIASRYNAEE